MKIESFYSSKIFNKIGIYHVLWWMCYELSITILTYRLILVSSHSVTNQNNYLERGKCAICIDSTIISQSYQNFYVLSGGG